ncbi:hypothetical protein PVA8_309 [Vibrio phage PVA8]|nr:hypothetical protein [Vibrio phage PC-Liy1]URQ03295.1 hypothetical protein PVA8_309 [Vibrio phage PVA8]WBM59029.1 hypothetical protein vBValMPVA8_307 [Vibrio phage vB_ValM_PVA8]
MTDFDIALLNPTIIKSTEIAGHNFGNKVIEIVSDHIDGDDMDNFIEFIVEAEEREREHPYVGHFYGDLLVMSLSEDRHHFEARMSDEDIANLTITIDDAFIQYTNEFIEWYKQKAREFFDDDELEFIIENEI